MVKVPPILQIPGILFHPHRSVGQYNSIFGAELEAGPGAVGKRQRRRDDAKNQQNPITGDLSSNMA
jgi:hypothetical protein